MTLKEITYFKEKENFEGNKELILIIDCYNCHQKEKTFFKSKKCISCFLNNLYKHKDRKFHYISILWDEILIKRNRFNLFLEYFKILNKIKRINNKIEKTKNQKCNYKEFKCKIFPNFSSLYNIKEHEFYDPILIYSVLINRLSNLSKKSIIDSNCQNCFNFIKTSEYLLFNILNNLKIIQEFKNFQNESKNHREAINFYEHYFTKSSLTAKNVRKNQSDNLNEGKKLLNSYNIGKYEIFKVQIYDNPLEIEKNYQVDFFYKRETEEEYFEKIIEEIHQCIEIAEFDQLIPLENLIKLYRKEAINILNSKYGFSKTVKNRIGFIAALKKLNLNKLFPLLIDDFIEEIFLDSPNDEIYINHQSFNRCRTVLRFNLKEIERIKTLIRLYSGQRLDYMNPIIKFVIKNKYFNCRFSIDVGPIQINNFALDIRKLNKNVLTIQDLLKNRTIDPLMTAFLYFNILRTKNITVTGETDTGKTTLINALDLLTPKEFRKIYVENTTESLNQFEYGKHQLKYKVDSLEEGFIEKYSKSNQIKTLLHRTPDIIYLGEILTEDEAKAMFHCLAAGLRGFQTIHSKNIDSLMNRFIYHFKINKSCLNDLDLLILMKKDKNDRRIVGIFEINSNENKLYNPIFEFNPETDRWLLLKSLYETNVIQDLKAYEELTKESFLKYINIFSEIFEYLLEVNKIDNYELISFFHKISYHSSDSIESLVNFWKNWKKNRTLKP
jgi:type IV secretory pathway ATPase VirB11/archaellum biosynthesis ATPase